MSAGSSSSVVGLLLDAALPVGAICAGLVAAGIASAGLAALAARQESLA